MENTIGEGFSQKSNRPEAGKNISLISRAISVLEPCGVFTLRQDEGMKSRGEGGLKCVTWSGVPTEVSILVHLSATIQTVQGNPPTGEQLNAARSMLREISDRLDYTTEEYTAVARRVVGDNTSNAAAEEALPRDILVQILRELLDRFNAGERVPLLASDKQGVPLRAWLPPDLVDDIRAFCHKRCTRTALFVTAATEFFSRRGVTLTPGA
ncbi:hypothetical protein GGE65_007254 [Skermanella aerolata]|uniref:hypothetical protein n=1 Tax=Skermanella aerolata TaxID=393310 RepID=UPI003D258E33